MEGDLKKLKMEDDLKKTKIKWKTNQSTKINLIGCDTIVDSPSLCFLCHIVVITSKEHFSRIYFQKCHTSDPYGTTRCTQSVSLFHQNRLFPKLSEHILFYIILLL